MEHGGDVIGRERILAAAREIEPLPASVTRLLALVRRGDFDTGEIVRVAGLDPALAGEILVRANSTSSGAREHIGDLQHAITRIGANAVVHLAIRGAMKAHMADPVPAYGLPPNAMWAHAILASSAADLLRESASASIPPLVTTAALLHDVGKLVIARCLPPSVTASIAAVAEAEHLDLDVAEREALGIDHAEVGALVVRNWRLPLGVQIALRFHHAPQAHDTLTHAIAMADHLAHAAPQVDPRRESDELERFVSVGSPGAESLGIDPLDLPRLLAATVDRANGVTGPVQAPAA